MNCKRGIFINELAQRPIAASPEKKQDRENDPCDSQCHSERPQTNTPPLARTQFHVQDVIALETTIARFAF